MGYYTYYRCEAACDDAKQEVILEWAKENLENLYYAVNDLKGYGGDNCKWYEHDEDMRKLSAQFPDVKFTLDGDGEENLDLWTHVYLGGECIKCSHTETDLHNYEVLKKLCRKLVNAADFNMKPTVDEIKQKLELWKELTDVS